MDRVSADDAQHGSAAAGCRLGRRLLESGQPRAEVVAAPASPRSASAAAATIVRPVGGQERNQNCELAHASASPVGCIHALRAFRRARISTLEVLRRRARRSRPRSRGPRAAPLRAFPCTSTSVGTLRTLKRLASSGCSSTSTRVDASAGAAPSGPAERAGCPSAGRDPSASVREEDEEVPAITAGPPGTAVHRLDLLPDSESRNALQLHWAAMGNWYSVGVFAGLGVALGIAAAGLSPGGDRASSRHPCSRPRSGVALGIVLADAEEAVGGGVGGIARRGRCAPDRRRRPRAGRHARGRGCSWSSAPWSSRRSRSCRGSAMSRRSSLPALGMRAPPPGGKRYAGLRTLARD